MLTTLFVLSLIGGFLSGLLGVGGAVVLIPMMLSVPPLVGVGSLSVAEVAGISIIQVLAASASGCIAHSKSGHVHKRTLLTIGLPMGFCSLAGAYLSQYMPDRAMLIVFGVLVVIAIVMLLRKSEPEISVGTEEADFEFNAPLSAFSGAAVGFAAGIVGAGGGFILIPVMVGVLGIPMRTAVGSSLGIVFIGALMGSIGKLIALQIQWSFVLPALLGSIPASQVGALVSKKLSAEQIRWLLLSLVSLTLLKTWWDILAPLFG